MKILKAYTLLLIVVILSFYAWNNLFISKRTFHVKSFNSMSIGGNVKVFIKHGEKEEITIRTEDSKHVTILPEVINGQLMICSPNCNTNLRVAEIEVTYVTLDSINLSGVSELTSRGTLKTGHFWLEVSGASETKLLIESQHVFLRMHDAANVQLAGQSDQFDLYIDHVGDLMAYNFLTKDTQAVIVTMPQSPGVARINVRENLDATIEGPRILKFKGDAIIRRQKLSKGGRLSRQ